MYLDFCMESISVILVMFRGTGVHDPVLSLFFRHIFHVLNDVKGEVFILRVCITGKVLSSDVFCVTF